MVDGENMALFNLLEFLLVIRRPEGSPVGERAHDGKAEDDQQEEALVRMWVPTNSIPLGIKVQRPFFTLQIETFAIKIPVLRMGILAEVQLQSESTVSDFVALVNYQD